ncbi:glutathione S-transferase 1-1 [Phlebotomus papatasi]|uniref:glutathione S-transferase 1-1 n=1 Tax=Phlebotomus papatasi TaxID=29031 RepID=UPI002483E728|nr:glutathione S-transferase 1-1 [Phlebotomus papatasi]XP_055699213.1 glutathione S-transferase 1-1 [Phlebotomus papatasi]
MKLYGVSDGPPSLAVRMALKALDIPFELVNVDYCAGEHLTEKYAEINPQKEIPVLDDDGFYLSESIAILQYLCDKYRPDSQLYPKDPKARAIVNHRLNFNSAFYYSSISMYVMAPIFFDYQRTPIGLKKLNMSLEAFETYMKRSGTKYAAADYLTIADFPLVTATLCLEAINFSLDEYTLVKAWYANFKKEYPDLWAIGEGGMKEIAEFEKNPPDLSRMVHPIHPMRKN